MAKQHKPVIAPILISLASVTTAAALAFLTLSEEERKKLIKTGADKLNDLNNSIQKKTKHFTDTLGETLQDAKDTVEVYGGIAAETVEEKIQDAKDAVEVYGGIAGETVEEKVQEVKDTVEHFFDKHPETSSKTEATTETEES